MKTLSKVQWVSVNTRKPKVGKIKLINISWWNKVDSGDANDFAYWSKDENRWKRFDKAASNPEVTGPHINTRVTHWAEQPAPPRRRSK